MATGIKSSAHVGELAARLVAWGVHAYTAAGALVAFLALDAVMRGEPVRAFWWLAVALLIDSSDGALARRFRVKEVIAQFDGSRLDDLVDYLNYVLVPMALMYRQRHFPDKIALLVVAAALLASAYGFCRKEAKTADNFFLGFPSYWNVVAFYVHALRIGQAAAAGWVLALSALVLVPVRFVYPSRTPFFRKTTVTLGVVWGAIVLACLWKLPAAPAWLLWLSLLFPAYYALLSLALEIRRRLCA